MKDIAIIGAGGFGREVLTILHDQNKNEKKWNIVGFFDDNKKNGSLINGYKVIERIQCLNDWNNELSAVIAIGSPLIRKSIAQSIYNPLIDFPTLIHPSVIIGDKNYVQIGKGCIICANNVITTNIEIGNFVIVNLNSTIGHDTVIGDYSALMPSCNISGEVIIGQEVYVGTGATIINQSRIGNSAIIGAGAVVIQDVHVSATVVGVPAKQITP